MESLFPAKAPPDPEKAWRADRLQYQINFYDAAIAYIKNGKLTKEEKAVLEGHCEMIKLGECYLDPDETITIVLERLDHHP